MQGNAGNRFQSSQYTIKYIGGGKPGLCHPDQFCVTYVYNLFHSTLLRTSPRGSRAYAILVRP